MPEPSLYFQHMCNRVGYYSDILVAGAGVDLAAAADDSIRTVDALIDEMGKAMARGEVPQAVGYRMFENDGGVERETGKSPIPMTRSWSGQQSVLLLGELRTFRGQAERLRDNPEHPGMSVEKAFGERQKSERAIRLHVSPYQTWPRWAGSIFDRFQAHTGGDSFMNIVSDAMLLVRLIQGVRIAVGCDDTDQALPADIAATPWAASAVRRLQRELDSFGQGFGDPTLGSALIAPPPPPDIGFAR